MAFVAPRTWPERIPPPAIKAPPTRGQWSLPASPLMRGERPNSPQTTMETSSIRPLAVRSSTRAVIPISSMGSVIRAFRKFPVCQSQLLPPRLSRSRGHWLKASVTHRTPASTSLRAIRKLSKCFPPPLTASTSFGIPYFALTLGSSSERSSA